MVICSVEINLIISENVIHIMKYIKTHQLMEINKHENPYPLQVIQPNSGHFHDAVTLLCTFGHYIMTGHWFSPGPPVSSTNETDRHDITEILLKVALNTIEPTNLHSYRCLRFLDYFV
jgi:hypothetical protein